MIGKTLNHYKILDKLGAGGMGEVYVAEDGKLHRKVALKILPAAMAADPGRRARFEREATAVAALNHPNIVTIYSVEEAEGVHFFTMELVMGKTLGETIPPQGMTLSQILKMALPLADALGAAHQQSIVHRDLKPNNILVSDEGRLKVLDFGLAKLADTGVDAAAATHLPTAPLTQEGKVVGTVAYMSPEQAEGKQIDPRSDVFSLGIILYEMATGRRPFQGETSLSTLTAILRDDPPAVTDLNRQLPKELSRIINRCLAKDPLRRFQSAVGLHSELSTVKEEVESGEISGPDISGTEETAAFSTQAASSIQTPASTGATPSPPAPNRRMMMTAGLVLAVVVLGVVGWLVTRGPGPDSALPKAPGGAAVGETSAVTSDQTRIVVLPFENLGAAEDEYFAAGMTEEITSRLASVSGLSVISRSSAVQYDRTGKTMDQIGQDLNVDYVLEGTVRWAKSAGGSSRIRITPELARVADDTHIWSDRYDRVMEDVFELQSEIAGAVVKKLGVALLAHEQEAFDAKPTENLEAYQALLRGKKLFDYFGRDNYLAAVRELEKAVSLDPEFALAWAELSQVRSGLTHFRVDVSEENLGQARAAAERALELQPDLLEGRLALGYYYYWGRKDYARSLQELDPLLQSHPNHPQVLEVVALIQRRQGKWDEAVSNLEKAMQFSPRDLDLMSNLVSTYADLRRFDEAEGLADQVLAIDPTIVQPYLNKIEVALGRDGDPGAAKDILVRSGALDLAPLLRYLFAWLEVLEGNEEEALAVIANLDTEGMDNQAFFTPNELLAGHIYYDMGDKGRAREACESARKIVARKIKEDARDPRFRVAMSNIHACLGEREEAIREARLATDLYPFSKDTLGGLEFESNLADVYMWVGDLEAGFDKLDWLLSLPGGRTINGVRLDPIWKDYLDHPRFKELVEKYGRP